MWVVSKLSGNADQDHLLLRSPVLCLYLRCVLISHWYAPSVSPLCYHVSALLSCCTQRWCQTVFSVFISAHPSVPWGIMTPRLRLALSCCALPPACFPFTDSVPLSLPSRIAAAFFWSLSPLLVKERHRQKRVRPLVILSIPSDSVFAFAASSV